MTNTTTLTPFDATAVEIPDDEPRQIVCTGEAGSDVWQPGFGTWEHDDFGIDGDEPVGEGERLFVNRRIYDALLAERDAALARAEAAEAERANYTEETMALIPKEPALHDAVATMVSDLSHTGDLSMLYRCEIADTMTALQARAEAAEADAAKARRFRDIARDEVKEWHEVAVSHAARVAELEAALPRAWERGRDAAAACVWSSHDNKDADYWGPSDSDIVRRGRAIAVRALTPPADLAEGGGE